MSKRYYDDRAKELYGSMKVPLIPMLPLGLLRYVPYLKDEKEKIQKFISGFPAAYRDQIEFE